MLFVFLRLGACLEPRSKRVSVILRVRPLRLLLQLETVGS